MSITITNSQIVTKQSITNTIDKLIDNLQGMEPKIKQKIVNFLNSAINNTNNSHNEYAHMLDNNRIALLNICKNLSADELKAVLNKLSHSISLLNYQDHVFNGIMEAMYSDLQKLEASNNLLKQENAKLHGIIQSTTEANKINAKQLQEDSIKAEQILHNKIDTTKSQNTLLLLDKYYNKING